MDKYNDLMYSWMLKRAHEDFFGEHEEAINAIYNKLYDQLKESFDSGYATGFENGFDDGKLSCQLKMLVRLVIHTDLEDAVILKVLGKENEQHFIDKLRDLRKK